MNIALLHSYQGVEAPISAVAITDWHICLVVREPKSTLSGHHGISFHQDEADGTCVDPYLFARSWNSLRVDSSCSASESLTALSFVGFHP